MRRLIERRASVRGMALMGLAASLVAFCLLSAATLAGLRPQDARPQRAAERKAASKGEPFQRAMDAMAISEEVTLFTMSDFARTLNSNGNGTDHAWGSVQFALGGAVSC